MNVADLIEALRTMPFDAEVRYLWDGAARSEVAVVYLARSGAVCLGDVKDDPVYYDEDRPADAPGMSDAPMWSPSQR